VLRGLSRTAAATFPAALSASARSLSAPAVQAIPKAQGSGALAAAFAAAAAAAAAAVAASPADNGAICEAKSMTIEEFELLALTPLDGR
jgi:predicted lipoprotein with Yx(FWY)xxD motif